MTLSVAGSIRLIQRVLDDSNGQTVGVVTFVRKGGINHSQVRAVVEGLCAFEDDMLADATDQMHAASGGFRQRPVAVKPPILKHQRA